MSESKVIEFPAHMEEKEYSEKTFDWLIDRAIEYLDFLKKSARRIHKNEWCKKLIAALKFLGDYKLDDEIQLLDE